MRKITVTDYKTKRINSYTGGKIKDHLIPDYPVSKSDDGMLNNSFISNNGTYMGDYQQGWWYFKNNMVVYPEYPRGVAYVLKQSGKIYPYWDEYNETGNIDMSCLEGIYGYSHRGGCLFSFGDRLFNEDYQPKQEDYTLKQWKNIEKAYNKMIKSYVKDGWYDNESEAKANCSISDVISFKMRGKKVIKSWQDAIDAAKNLSNYLG